MTTREEYATIAQRAANRNKEVVRQAYEGPSAVPKFDIPNAYCEKCGHSEPKQPQWHASTQYPKGTLWWWCRMCGHGEQTLTKDADESV